MEVTGRQFCLNIRNNIVTMTADQSENGLPCAVVSSPSLVTRRGQMAVCQGCLQTVHHITWEKGLHIPKRSSNSNILRHGVEDLIVCEIK